MYWQTSQQFYQYLLDQQGSYRSTLDKKARFHRFSKIIRTICPSLYELPQNPGHDAPMSGNSAPLIIHIAGSKAKGSVAQFLSYCFQSWGLSAGVFTSPHALHFKERIQINTKSIPEKTYISSANQLWEKIQKENQTKNWNLDEYPLHFFEWFCAWMACLFTKLNLDVWIIETGIGGLWDPTNVFPSHISIITMIDLEHRHLLGSTYQEIAQQKLGIIKKNTVSFLGFQHYPIKSLFQAQGDKQNSLTYCCEDMIDTINLGKKTALGQKISIKTKWAHRWSTLIQNLGTPSIENASLVCLCLQYLEKHKKTYFKRSLHIPASSAFYSGIKKNILPFRLQVIHQNPQVILDVAHTPLSIKKSLQAAYQRYHCVHVLISLGVDKEIDNIASVIFPYAQSICITEATQFKPSDAQQTWNIFQKHRPSHWPASELIYEKNNEKALELVKQKLKKNQTLLITGSFYLIQALFKFIQDSSFSSQ